MPDRGDTIPILRTKLYRPSVTDDVVCRKNLHERLEAGAGHPLTLVSAPAGYGKSTLVGHWLEGQGLPSAWVSLDKEEGDLRIFLRYLVAAVQEMFPDACADMRLLLESIELPSIASVADCLINDLAAIESRFILVFDDYHRLESSLVHELLGTVLKHPPRSLRLVLITRRNPPLPLASLRAQDRMTEVRLRDLEFSQDETTVLLERAAASSLEPAALAHVHKSTEGWAVGLRMAILAMRYHEDRNEFLQSFGGDIRQVQDYLISEVMEHEEPAIRDRLCKISILDRFSAPLCAAICDVEATHTDGRAFEDIFVALLERSGILCIALDGNRQWFRFHHLFQELLRQQLVDRFPAEEIYEMHARAAEWLEGEGYLEEAIHHLGAAGDVPGIHALILRNRRSIYHKEQWLRLETLMSSLPSDVVQNDPDLLMIKCWIGIIRQRYPEIWQFVQRTEELLQPQRCTKKLAPVFGQLDIFLSWRSFAAADGATAFACAKSAVKRLPDLFDLERGFAQMMFACSLQMVGREAEGIQYIYDALDSDRHAHPIYRVRLLEALGFLLWMGGDLARLREAGVAMIRLGEKEALPVTIKDGHYIKGKALYSLGELEEAKELFTGVLKPGYRATDRYLIRSTYLLAKTYNALGEPDRAVALLDQMAADLLDDANSNSLSMVRVFQAELALRQGRLADATSWLETFEPSATPRSDAAWNDELIATNILWAQRTPASLKKASEQLAYLKTYFEKIHNIRFLIEALALQALVFQALEEGSRAEACLEQAIKLALPCGFIRLFVDLGPELSKMLNRLNLNEETLRYVGKIQAAFRGPSTETDPSDTVALETVTLAPAALGLLDPLTKREYEILALLANRKSNQEIADALGISVKTIRRHTENLYSKLGVHGRHEAVAKAEGLGIIK